MDESPTTEQPARTNRDPRAGKRRALPAKLISLRQKLGHKAKQEPKFRFYALNPINYDLTAAEEGSVGVTLTTGAAASTYCTEFSGISATVIADNQDEFKLLNGTAPAECPVP